MPLAASTRFLESRVEVEKNALLSFVGETNLRHHIFRSITCSGLVWVVIVVLLLAAPPVTAAGDEADEVTLEKQLGEVFYRSMKHWRYNYSKIPDRKAGVACIPWQRLDSAFLDDAIFEALGFSYSMAADEGAIRVATDGCNRMRAHYRLNDCACELVLIGEKVVVVVPEGVRR